MKIINLRAKSLAVKIALVILLGMSIIVIGSYYFISNNSYEAAKNDHIQKTRELLNFSSDNIDQYLDNSWNAIEYVATSQIAINALQVGNKESLDKFTYLANIVQGSRTWALSGVSVFDMNCVLRAGDDSVASVVGKDFSHRDYCNGILKEKKSYTGDVVISSATGVVVLTIATPIKLNGEMIGFVASGINLDPLFERLPVRGGEHYYFVLVDKSGNIILDSRDGIVKQNIITPVAPNKVGGKVFAKVKDGNEGEIVEMTNELGENHLIGFNISKNHKIITIVGEPVNKVTELGDYLNSMTVRAMLVMLLMGFILVLGTTFALAKRLNKITHIVSNISKGDFTVKIDSKELNSKDEIGDLARAFERVMVSLKLAMKELEDKSKK